MLQDNNKGDGERLSPFFLADKTSIILILIKIHIIVID